MYQDLDDPVDVIAAFESRRLRPVRFRWNDRVYKVARVTGSWKSQRGEFSVRHFAVVDTQANFFELTYDERLTSWILTKTWVE